MVNPWWVHDESMVCLWYRHGEVMVVVRGASVVRS